MKHDVVIRQYIDANGLMASHSKFPELVVDGVVTELPNVDRISWDTHPRDVVRVTVSFVARLEIVREEPKKPKYCGCGHPAHPGLVCGWPTEDGSHCECEG